MHLLSTSQGWFLILVYGAVMFTLTAIFARHFQSSKLAFLVANREVGSWASGFSIAATWIWAPALFVAAQKAYTQGIVGVFWFTVPNVLCLVIFSWFAKRVREKLPDGYTFSGFIQEKYSKRVHNLYLLQLSGLSACSFAVQLLAGGAVVSELTGIGFLPVTVALAAIALIYSFISGIKASIVTDYAQMVLIAAVGFALVPWAISNAGGFGVVLDGLGGRSGTFTNLFSGDGLGVFWAFGIPVTIGLMAGPFGDQSFWQRAFSTRKDQVRSAFLKSALIFSVVPVLMALLGFAAAGSHMDVAKPQLTNLAVVVAYLPKWTVYPFMFMLLSGLVSTLDSCLCAISSLGSHDVLNRMGITHDKSTVKVARYTMVGLALCSLLIANIPGMSILYLFLFYGTLRASTLLPTVISIIFERVSEAGVFWGILLAILIGLPIFAYGKFTGSVPMIVFGSLFTVLSSGTMVALVTWLTPRKLAEANVND